MRTVNVRILEGGMPSREREKAILSNPEAHIMTVCSLIIRRKSEFTGYNGVK